MKHLALALTLLAAPLAAPLAAQAPFWTSEWPDTDFGNTSVDFTEILSGGPGKDGIPALNDPAYEAAATAAITPQEAVLTVELNGQARAYPIRYLMWHEIANTEVGGVPLAVTYCPLCNSGIVFDRRLNGQVLDFGVTGKLRYSDMVMFDRQTESWWQQFTGKGIVGDMNGAQLTQVISWMEPMGEFVARNPEGEVMARPDSPRSYGTNPYNGYDSAATPFLYRGENPPHGIPPLARVVRVGNRAWTLDRLQRNPEIVEEGVRIVWESGMASPLDTARISAGRDIGSVRVYDAATGANILHEVVFAFAFHAFEPDGIWMLGPE